MPPDADDDATRGLTPLERRIERLLAIEERAGEIRREENRVYKDGLDRVLKEIGAVRSDLNTALEGIYQRFRGLETRVGLLEGQGPPPSPPLPVLMRPRSMSPTAMAAVDPNRPEGTDTVKVPAPVWKDLQDQVTTQDAFAQAQAQKIDELQKQAQDHRVKEAIAEAKAQGAQELVKRQEEALEKSRTRVSGWWIPVLGFLFLVLSTFVTWWITLHPSVPR
jgi:hypothetical protein